MRALIALTLFMGVLIIAGLAVVLVTIFHRMSTPKPDAPMLLVTGPVKPGRASIALPPGALVKLVIGAGDRVVLHLVAPDGSDTLITLDPATGTVLETIDLVPQPPAESK